MVDGKEKKRHRIGLMGGTFDPIHIGHLMLAECAYEQFDLEQVLFLPSGNPPHKRTRVGASDQQRMDMVRLAIDANPHFALDSEEMYRSGYTYTNDTLEILTAQHPDTDYYFIMGADSLFQIETWHEPAVIMADCVILAAMRNHTPDDVFKKQMDYLEAKYHADIRFLNIPDLALSSSEIRHRVREHQSIRFMVPEGVREYIEEHQLYCR